MIMVIVTLLGVKVINSTHADFEWAFETHINGKELKADQTLEVCLEQGKLFFELKAIEYDKNVPDIAIHKEILDYHRIINDDGTPIRKDFVIEVEEHKGSGRGNRATITFQFKIKELIKVSPAL